MSTKQTGDRGEALAAEYLAARGYRILARNYRHERAEIDLVCAGPAQRDAPAQRALVFVEVKARSGLSFGRPEEAVTETKQQHLVRAATAYLHERRLEDAPVRFDVVSVMLRPGRAPSIRHFENAFRAGRY